MTESPLSSMPLSAASAFWLEQHKRYIKPNTVRNYTGALKVLSPFFGEILLRDITITDICRYQAERGKKAGPYLLNSEISVLQMILKEARCWKQIADLYKPMRVPKRRAGHSISADEERVLREVAFSRPKWRLAAHCMMVMLSTTMGFGELRHVRRRDVDLKRKSILVRDGAKNDHRDRTIPMNAAALDSMLWILDRWERLGGHDESEFILPHRPRSKKGPWILTEPMSAITSAFNGIRKEAGLPKFRVYDCRVQAITKLLSNPDVSPQVSKEIAGHISQVMQNPYSIQQFDTKLAALQTLETPSIAPVPPEPTTPAQELAPPLGATQTAIQAEIARQVDRKVALALQEYFASQASGEIQGRRRRTRRNQTASGSKKEESVFSRQQNATNLIAFPTRLA
jgi:integrase